MDESTKQYQQGFNHGYLISEHMPKLSKLFSNSPATDNDYFKGFISGKQEHEMEKIREKLKSSSPDKLPIRDKDITKENNHRNYDI